jgi:hypothetical protein
MSEKYEGVHARYLKSASKHQIIQQDISREIIRIMINSSMHAVAGISKWPKAGEYFAVTDVENQHGLQVLKAKRSVKAED